VLGAGERRGEPIPGFDLGNSPIEFAAPRVRGKIVIFTTSNGTGALLAARRAADVGVASLVNLTAAATWALAQGRDVIALCAGERGAQSLEDYVCAGLLVDRLAAAAPTARPTARAAEAAHAGRAYGKDVARLRKDAPWARRLIAAGRGDDVGVCLALDTATLVPRYLAAVDKVVAGP
jgi:2-phosphosulfolactate phosphatase